MPALSPPPRLSHRRHHSEFDLPAGAADDVLTTTTNTPDSFAAHHAASTPSLSILTPTTTTTLSPSPGPAPPTPNSHISDPSTDGSRSIPNVDVHTLAHLLSAPPRPPSLPRATLPSRRKPDLIFRPIRPDLTPAPFSSQPPSSPPSPLHTLPLSASTSGLSLARPTPTRPPDYSHRISWHRSRTELTRASVAVVDPDAATTAAAAAAAPVAGIRAKQASPSRRHRSDGAVAAWRIAARSSAGRLADVSAAPWPSSLHAVPPRPGKRTRRRRSSHLAGALRRKVSAVVWGGERGGVSEVKNRGGRESGIVRDDGGDGGRNGNGENGRKIDDEMCRGEQGDGESIGVTSTSCTSSPVCAYAPLAPFGLNAASDAIVLYTNSVRAEVNDLIFLATLLQRAAGVDGAAVRKRHRALDVDFELWFSRFSQYCGLILFGIEELVMRAVGEVLGQRDVMLSRASAAAEADGTAMSRAAAWTAASRTLYSQMDRVRDALNEVATGVVWLRRARALREPGGASWLRAVAGVRRLAPAALALMDEVDARVSEALVLRAEWPKTFRPVYRQFAALLAREGPAPLAWGAVSTLTRWIADRRLRAEHVRALSRAARLSVFARLKGDCSHQAIVRVHQGLATDERRVRFFL